MSNIKSRMTVSSGLLSMYLDMRRLYDTGRWKKTEAEFRKVENNVVQTLSSDSVERAKFSTDLEQRISRRNEALFGQKPHGFPQRLRKLSTCYFAEARELLMKASTPKPSHEDQDAASAAV